MSGPIAAYDVAIRALANALDQPSLQIAHGTMLALEYAQGGNRNGRGHSHGDRAAASGCTRRLHVVKARRKIALAAR
jgi:hypothetical protein